LGALHHGIEARVDVEGLGASLEQRGDPVFELSLVRAGGR
jgi:hypothetical protein